MKATPEGLFRLCSQARSPGGNKHQRQGHNQCPADNLPFTQFTRKLCTFGIAEATHTTEASIRRSPVTDTELFWSRANPSPADCRQQKNPESQLGPVASPDNAENSRRHGQQTEEDNRVSRGNVLQRHGCQKRKTNHYTCSNDNQRNQLMSLRTSLT